MGWGTNFKCNKCGHALSTYGFAEFYRDCTGQRKDYGHPVPASEEAKRSGIWGFYGILYCPTCRELQDVILQEFEKPCYHSLWGRMGADATEQVARCPKCGNADLILCPPEELDPPQYKELSCPKCSNGRLLEVSTFQT